MSDARQPYVILEACSPKSMENEVRIMLLKGYVPLGGVQVVGHAPVGELCRTFKFYQAMVYNEV